MKPKIYNNFYLKSLSNKQVDFFFKDLKPSSILQFKIKKNILLRKVNDFVVFSFKVFKIPNLDNFHHFKKDYLKYKNKTFLYYFISISKKIGKVNKRVYIKRFINRLLIFNFKKQLKNKYKNIDEVIQFLKEYIIFISVKKYK
jgi:uncharacterized C2H2 Zn-finger protein